MGWFSRLGIFFSRIGEGTVPDILQFVFFLLAIPCFKASNLCFEIAYTLTPSAWGHGYAREGAAAALRYAREVLGRTRIASIIRPANVASIRVAQSLGAIAGEAVEFFGAPSTVYWYTLRTTSTPEPDSRPDS